MKINLQQAKKFDMNVAEGSKEIGTSEQRYKYSTRAFLNYSKYTANIGIRIPIRIQIARR